MGDDEGKAGGSVCPMLVLLAVSIAILVIGSDDVPDGWVCGLKTGSTSSLDQDLGIKKWMLTSGATGIAIFGLMIVAIIGLIAGGDSGAGKGVGVVCLVLVVLLSIFNFCWNIVGSVIFWRDCLNGMPNDKSKDMMMARLIICYIFGVGL